MLSDMLSRTGLLRALDVLPSRPGILMFNHHRIGDPSKTSFDRGVFSSTADQLDAQIRYLRRRMPIVSGEELEALVLGKTRLRRSYAAITFDDGYLDNYTEAFPVLRSHDATATFFLITTYVGTATIPWWDEIAFLIRNTSASTLHLKIPTPATLRLDANREPAIHAVLSRYKLPANHDGAAFLAELREQTGVAVPSARRRFVSWDEARTMKAGGMEIGSHTCTHRLLSQLPPEEQAIELRQSKIEMERELGCRISSFAYPVGLRTAFTPDTEDLARAAGYTMCFAYHGGLNLPGNLRPMHLNRTTPSADSNIFRTQTIFMSAFARAM